MARKGRGLEKLVALLEEKLGPNGIQVTSPDFIEGKFSKSKREVDVSLRSRIGSSNILVIIECRDRLETEEATWIEQIAKKIEDVGADKAIAVSSVGFTSGAVNTAKMYNIELRTFEEINPEDILLWFEMDEIVVHRQCCNFLHYEFRLATAVTELPQEFTKALGKTLTPPFDIKVPIFRAKKDGAILSLEDFWNKLPRQEMFKKINPGESKKTVRLRIDFPKGDELQILTSPDPMDIDHVDMVVELWIEIEKKPLKSVKLYKDENRIIAKTADFESVKFMGKKLTIGFHQFPETEEQFISTELENEP